jgi:hypothetical protein
MGGEILEQIKMNIPLLTLNYNININMKMCPPYRIRIILLTILNAYDKLSPIFASAY